MSRDHRKDPRSIYNKDREWDRERDRIPMREHDWERDRDQDRDRDRNDYRNQPLRKRSRTPPRRDDNDKRRSRSPRENAIDLLDENILSEISKLPEPSELWDNQQFQEAVGFPTQPPPGFTPQEGVTLPAPASYTTNYQPSYSGIYDDFPSVVGVPQAPLPPDMSAWNQMSLPPPPTQAAPPAPFLNNVEDQIKKEVAIESEMRQQKAALFKQREDYIKKANILKKEMDTLKDQRNELCGDAKRSPIPDTKRFLKENTKLQLEIQNKLERIYNVVDMLNGLIGEEAQETIVDEADSKDRNNKRKSRSPSNKFNYVYYDPEMHWCRVCNEFPPTAKDYLNHLHSAAHHKMAAAHMEAPWHSVSGVNEGFPSFPAAPTKRTPIKGLQFFVPSTAWYCKLCDQFIGDLHCASTHLKSVLHSKNYTNFVEQNPHWETDWMSDRQKAFEKNRATKGKTESEKPDDKKKKDKKKKNKRKSSSSSSSDSSSSDSEPVKKKKTSKRNMPVYKHLGKNSKTEEQKKEKQKKKEQEEDRKKRREEMDAEIQKKVAEFKEKIAHAQLERQAQVELGPPPLALPTQLAATHAPPTITYVPAPQVPHPAPPQLMPPPTPAPPQQPALPKDFQDALDIIIPTEVKADLSQADGLFPLPPGFVPGLGGVMPPFPPLPLMQQQMTQMFGFDLNGPLFQPRTQLYDTHVPLVPSPKPRQQHYKNRNKQKRDNRQKNKNIKPAPPTNLWPRAKGPVYSRPAPRFAGTQSRPYCDYCKATEHGMASCPAFLELHVSARRRIANARRLCFSCLGDHFHRNCPKPRPCRICEGAHLHILCANANRSDRPVSEEGSRREGSHGDEHRASGSPTSS